MTIMEPATRVSTEHSAATDDDARPGIVPTEEHLRELVYGRDQYAEEFASVAADSASHEILMRRHFAAWADNIASATLGPNSGEAQWARFREHLADPERYPGGRDGLLVDAIHAEAVRRLGPRLRQAVIVAQQELASLERDERSLERREVCSFCLRKRDGIGEHQSGRVGLDTRKLCDSCVQAAQREHTAWKSTPVPVRDSW